MLFRASKANFSVYNILEGGGCVVSDPASLLLFKLTFVFYMNMLDILACHINTKSV